MAYVDYDAVSYQKWPDIKVYGHVRSGTLTVTVERNDAEGQARVPKGELSEIGRLKDSCRPTMWVRQLMGVQGNVWLELLVTSNGVIYLHNIYETEDMYWGSFFGTISCPVKPS